MVDSIGPDKISAIAKSKPVARGKLEKPKRDSDQPGKDSPQQDREQQRVGGNIDERC